MNFIRFFLLTFVFLFVACGKSTETEEQTTHKEKSEAPKDTRPNFVFIFADDQSPKTIGAYGNSVIKTPNLDKLAQQGVNFSNAYNMGAWNGAVCVASRTMLNTGLSVWDAYQASNSKEQKQRTDLSWAKLLENQGYDTYMTGKWHIYMDAQKTFQTTKNIRPGMPMDRWDHKLMVERFKDLEDGKYNSYEDFMPIGYNRPKSKKDRSWEPTDPLQGGFYHGGKHWSEVLKDDALGFIEQAKNKDKPFFMYLAFNAPHDPRQAPQAYQDLYNENDIPLPENWKSKYPRAKAIGNDASLRDAALAPFPRTKYATKVHLKEYYAIISHLDTQIGAILEALKASGKMDNTYIIYTADHGLAVGEHGLFGKQNMYEHSVRAPFIIWGPGMQGGKTVAADIYLQDVMATTLDLAGAEKPQHIFFNSIAGLARGTETESHYDAIYGAYMTNQRMIKKDGYKLIVYPVSRKVKLFNVKADPEEMNNLANTPEHREKALQLFEDLMNLQKDMKDPLDIAKTYKRYTKS